MLIEELEGTKDGTPMAHIYLQELERIKFVLKSYLRVRLEKVGSCMCVAHPHHEECARLTPSWVSRSIRLSGIAGGYTRMCQTASSSSRTMSKPLPSATSS
jgi:hypothetical protein